MKRLLYILFVITIAGCSLDYDIHEPHTSSGAVINVMGRPISYSKAYVTTKSTRSLLEEDHISNMTMLIFDSEDKLVGSPISIYASEPVFIIDTDEQKIGSVEDTELVDMNRDNNQVVLENARIYIVANAAEYIKNETISEIGDLDSISLDVIGLSIPDNGFPMIGNSEPIDLRRERDTTSGDVVREIPLSKLYAKIDFKIRVNATQTGNTTPSFTLKKWVVGNAPNYVTLGQYVKATNGDTIDSGTVLGDFESSSISDGNYTIYSSSSSSDGEYVTFSFYIPEYKITPDNYPYKYPDNKIDTEVEKQKYKPMLLSERDNAPYVSVYGQYVDHGGNLYNIVYKIYLGQNSVDDFHVERNWNLVNNVIIKGVTNNNFIVDVDGNKNISVDYRVTVEEKNLIVYIERESMLDAHYEVRPLVVYINNNGSVTVTINDNCTGWIKLSSDSNPKDYFYTDLVTNTGDGHLETSCKIEKTRSKKIWFYIDENTEEVSRQGTVSLVYSDESGVEKENHTLVLTQTGLLLVDERWDSSSGQAVKVTNDKGEDFYIESYEEYLHHFDPLDLPSTERIYEGLPWGVLTTDVTEHPEIGGSYYNNYYNGDDATPVIVSKYNASDDLKLSETPTSAAEYCWNKNKRNRDGKVNTDNGTWYLPGIREMEAAFYEYYDVFHEFQENFYWSSAPGKGNYLIFFYRELTEYARATKAVYSDGSFTYIGSEEGDPGSKKRGDTLRIRCAYKNK